MFNLCKSIRQYHSHSSMCKSAGNPFLKVELEGRLKALHRCRAVRAAPFWLHELSDGNSSSGADSGGGGKPCSLLFTRL